MKTKLTLTFQYQQHPAREIPVNSKRFTIGSRSDNDLVIDDAQVAPRHAIIETFDLVPKLTDFDSATGTFLNQRRITSSATLQNCDVITLGAAACRLTVHYGSPTHPAVYFSNRPPHKPEADSNASRRTINWWLEPPVLAVIPVLLMLCGFLLYKFLSQPHQPDIASPSPSSKPSVSPTPKSSPSPTLPKPPLNPTEDMAEQVIKSLGREQSPYVFPKKQHVDEIEARIRSYQQQAAIVEATLKALQPQAKMLAQKAESRALPPHLVLLVALTEAVQKRTAGQAVSPIAIAPRVQDDIIWHRVEVGYEKHEETLLSLASYGLGRNTAPQSKLQGTLESGKLTNAALQRNIWYMYEHEMLPRQGYDFALCVLALGVIAQNPQQFQLKAAPLSVGK